MSGAILAALAAAAGVESVWRDATGVWQTVAEDNLRAVLEAIGVAADTPAQIAESHNRLARENAAGAASFITGDCGAPTHCPGVTGAYRIRLESGRTLEGDLGEDAAIPAIDEPGYHSVETAGGSFTLAIAPVRAFTIEDALAGKKAWGLAVQLYSLRHQDDGGIGDFEALAQFTRAAASKGADAVAISPVHAQFSGDLTKFSPYAPSSRAAVNVLHIAEPTGAPSTGEHVDWQAAGAGKLAALRRRFASFKDHAALHSFRASAGPGLERHAIFEALHGHFSKSATPAGDWRQWPAPFQNPASPEVARFCEDHAQDVAFHLYLQYRADLGLAAAQAAARAAGMKIGIIADLAVGTDPAGSHSWSRHDEILRGLEIGAPPDIINREGQSWGITAFSPRGLRNSGFAAFIEMLRFALRHAGGVRIDHIMGLARLWVIPHGRTAAQGAYLRMPARDLLRLVKLESQRHKAVILGEDLGTLPEGFQTQLEDAGISGLRVMWFERDGQAFRPPRHWSQGAVAMTSTHDLPTVAGWWEGRDIAWRQKLRMAGDDQPIRDADRDSLWQAFGEAGAAQGARPAIEDGAAAADAAVAFLGLASSSLALLPIEDALAAPEQPNLPGTLDEHPNWRRRLPADAGALLDRPDVAARLAALNAARVLP